MATYSQNSEYERSTATDTLQRLFGEVIKWYDNTVIKGFRPNDEQRELFAAKRSKIKEGGKHNQSPSQALDVAPYIPGRKIPWPKVPSFMDDLTPAQKKELKAYVKDMGQFYHFAGYVQGTGDQMGIPTRWGGDWDKDRDISDQHFDDLVHFEDA